MLPNLSLVALALAMIVPPAGSLGLDALLGAPTVQPGEVPNEIIVGFRDAIPGDVEAWVGAQGGQLLMRDDVLRWVSVRLPDAASAEKALARAAQREDVRYAQRDGYVQALLIPNDPLYDQQWGYPAILAPAAWDVTLGSHAVKVSVLDTGIQTNHPDLAANACGPFTSFNPNEPTIADGHGHGTHVSGTVAAVTDNGVGVAGTSQSCLMGAKVLSAFGSGQWSWVAAGIRWSADNGAHIISMSLGGGNPGQIMVDAVRYAYNTKGVLIVAAAGNSGCPDIPPPTYLIGTNQGTVIYPAVYDEVMAVAALSPPDGNLAAGFSSCGPDVEVAAPGEGVLSTWKNSGYVSISGTSMATPHVSGVAALVKAQNPAITAVQLRCLLDLSADELAPLPARDYQTGWGRVSPVKALALDQLLKQQALYGTFEQACVAGAKAIMY